MSKRIEEGRPGRARKVMNPWETDPAMVYDYDRGSNYETDTRVTRALDVLIAEAELSHPDLRMFQTVHLVTEYAWCLMHFEIRRAIEALECGDYARAGDLIERTENVAVLPLHCVGLLMEHLPQRSLLLMRGSFPPNTTGLDSPGARNLRRVCKALWQRFADAMEREGTTLAALIDLRGRLEPAPESRRRECELSRVRDAIHRLDERVTDWKSSHLRMTRLQLGGHPDAVLAGSVEMAGEQAEDQVGGRVGGQIGEQGVGQGVGQVVGCPAGGMVDAGAAQPTSLRGSPIAELEQMARRSLFPLLWSAIDDEFRTATATPGDAAW